MSDSFAPRSCQNAMRSTGEAQRLLALRGDGVVEADALDEAAVAAVARIRNDDIEERALLGAATG